MKNITKEHAYAIILCGGSGSRLWPRSRSAHPKHLLDLNDGSTLVQQTVDRLDLPAENIYCITEASHAELLRGQLPKIAQDNVLVEPGRRGTAPAIGLGLTAMEAIVDPEAIIVSIHADQVIQDQELYTATIKASIAAARATDRIVTLGIRPTYPSTGFGYINFDEKLTTVDQFDVFGIARFVEKPNEETAKIYVDSGRYLWNSGMFTAKFSVWQREFETHLPDIWEGLQRVKGALSDADFEATVQRYLELPEETIDVGVMEKSRQLAVIPAEFGWADVGSWADLHDMLERDADGNVFEGNYIDIDSRNCFIHSPQQLVATIGLDNLVIINTGDAVLICPKDRSQDVKKVVQKLKTAGLKDYL